MACRIVCVSAGAIRHLAAAASLVAVAAVGAAAQTLSEPAPPAKFSPPSKAAKSQAEHAKACSSFGPGFVNVPGTDACVKIGGSVTVEGSARR